MAPAVTNRTVVSYAAFPPLPTPAWPECGNPKRIPAGGGLPPPVGGISLLHYPWSRLHRTLSGILPCEARTFLTCGFPQPRSFILLSMTESQCSRIAIYLFYTWKQLPPTNSLQIEFLGRSSLLTPIKYSKNFNSLFAS